MNRFSGRISRAFGRGGSRPQSGVMASASRPISEVPETAAETATPATGAEAHAPEVSGPETNTSGERSVIR